MALAQGVPVFDLAARADVTRAAGNSGIRSTASLSHGVSSRQGLRVAQRVGVAVRRTGSRGGRMCVAAADGEGEPTTVKGEDGVDVLPSGEWAHNFSMLNYEDLHKHYEQKTIAEGLEGEAESNSESSPLLPEQQHGVVSGEWSKSISILSYEDLSAFFQKEIFKKGAQPESLVADVMSREVRSAFPDSSIGEVSHHFEHVTGLPVVNQDLVCVGVLSKGEAAKAGPDAKVGDVMVSPPVVTMTPDKSVMYAAVLMLKNKVHRIPVVNDAQQLVGIVTRTDIFTVLETAQ